MMLLLFLLLLVAVVWLAARVHDLGHDLRKLRQELELIQSRLKAEGTPSEFHLKAEATPGDERH
jgi:hypothetical protein